MAEAEAEWAPKQDMSLLCRVCANQHDYLIPIFQGEGLDHEMPTKMGKHLPIKVRATDKLPTQMCYQCASTIIAWSELHTNCLAADKKLKGMLKKDGVVEDDNAASDHYEDAFDDGGGAQDDDDEEDFEKEIKQLISDAGVELGSNKEVKRAPRVPVTRKRKAEVTITPVVKKEPKKLKTEPLPAKSSASKSTSAKSNASASKTSTALVKPKEEVVPNEERFTCHQCLGTRASGCRCRSLLYQCELCLFGFMSNTDLIEHVSSCESEFNDGLMVPNQTVYLCPVCKLILSSKKILQNHMTYHDHHEISVIVKKEKRRKNKNNNETPIVRLKQPKKPINPKSLECLICEKKCNTQYQLEDHYKDFHEGETPFICELCGKKCATPRRLQKHKLFQHPIDLPHVCNYCGKRFLMPSVLKLHERKHTGEKPLVCEFCGKNFGHASSLILHKRMTHRQGEMRYKCEFCGEAFCVKRAFTLHVQAHTNPRPYECNACHKSFKEIYDLKAHEKFVHTNIRPYKCNQCTADFKNQKHLKRHCKTIHKSI